MPRALVIGFIVRHRDSLTSLTLQSPKADECLGELGSAGMPQLQRLSVKAVCDASSVASFLNGSLSLKSFAQDA